jgi:hypothetical protein
MWHEQGEEECVYVIGGKAREKEITGNTKTWLDNVEIDVIEIGWDGVEWIGLAQHRDK